MHKFSATLKSHTFWCKISEYIDNEHSLETIFFKKHKYFCKDYFDLEISNYGEITFIFKKDTTKEEARNFSAIFLYFISLCCGFNCEYFKDVYIDDIKCEDFFNFAKEDELPIKDDKFPTGLYKNVKPHEIGLEEISNNFNEILFKLYNLKINLTLLSNFYALVFYKDFIGNGAYLFRIIVTNIESLITLIKKEDYRQKELEHEKFLNLLKDNIKSKKYNEVFKEINVSCTKLSEHLQLNRIPLHKKLKDTFLHFEKYGLIFKLDIEKETKKIADTRNFISHNFDKNKVYLTQKERSDYTALLRELFRMLFLEYCEVDISIIKQNFYLNPTQNCKNIRETLEKFFTIIN